MANDTVFGTPRTLVRRWRASDREALLSIYGDAEAMRWVDDGQPISLEETDRWLEITQANYRRRGYGMFAVELRAQADVIGFCGLVHPGGQHVPEIKYAYARAYWGRGIATEVATAAIAYGAQEHGMQRIIATVAPENIASQRVLLNAGMFEGELLQHDDGTKTQVFVWEARHEA